MRPRMDAQYPVSDENRLFIKVITLLAIVSPSLSVYNLSFLRP